ncbi:MAG: glycine-rich protein [Ignavibacteriales bacterium]
MNNKKGFTLMELLAVIVILAIIAAITVPIIVGIIDRTRESSYKESVRSIFEATKIYVARQEFKKFPVEGINVTDPVLEIKNKNFTSGKIVLNNKGIFEVEKVSNGRYCAGGTLEEIIVIEGSCDQLDVTPPTVNLTSNFVTSSSITTVATGEDLESGMNGYQFSKDNGTTWTNKQTSNVYTFNNLKNNTDYTFKVKAINNNQLSTISGSITVRTNDIVMPTYSIDTTDWVSSAVVTIHYPARETGYVYQYSLDNALTWLTVDAPTVTKDITFTDNGNVIARILDGPNEIIGTSYIVTKIDKYNPSVGITVAGTPFNGSGWANANFNLNIQGTDNESGVKGYTYCQTTSATCTPTTVVNAVSGTVTISTESATNKVCAFSTDNANNDSSVVCSDPYKLDKVNPGVIFGTNGNVTYAKSRSTTVTVSDTNSGVLTSTLKYQWTTSTTAPTEASFITMFTNGGTLTTPAGVSGGYYLWILGKDNAGNTIIARSNVFNLDNIVPVITVTPATVNTFLNSTYTDTGVTASDNTGGNITASIVTTGNVNTAVVCTYTLTYNVSDAAGNVAVTQTRTVNVISQVFNYDYTGAVQTFVVPTTGTYKLELWGAQGGGTTGGNGGYSTGNINLTAGQTIYIYVGGQGASTSAVSTGGFNGGGTGGDSADTATSGGGGGASDVRVGGTALTNRIIVAGGGGGGTSEGSRVGGVGGGTSGGVGTGSYDGGAGTQTAGGAAASGGTAGVLGQGGNGGNATGDTSDAGGGGGGGGYYGGGGGRGCNGSSTMGTGGGGSGYIGGVTSGQTIAGSSSMPNPGGSTMTGRLGNGYARITFVG